MKRIWSFEHDAWWRPNELGYTRRLAEAGLYSDVDAARIVARANRYRDVPFEAAIDPCVLDEEICTWMELRARLPVMLDMMLPLLGVMKELAAIWGTPVKNYDTTVGMVRDTLRRLRALPRDPRLPAGATPREREWARLHPDCAGGPDCPGCPGCTGVIM